MFEPIVIWDLPEDDDGNYVHIVVEHGISQEEVEDVLQEPTNDTVDSRSSGRPITFGWTSTGLYLAVVWEHVDDDPRTVKPVTAYPTDPPRSKQRRKS